MPARSNKKRPPSSYQPAITSYFGFSGNAQSFTARSDHPLPQPSLSENNNIPESTQRSLLQVGMRVRKAVGDGFNSSGYSYKKSGAELRDSYYSGGSTDNFGMSSSQESTSSTFSTESKKRGFDDSDDEDEVCFSSQEMSQPMPIPNRQTAHMRRGSSSCFYNSVERRLDTGDSMMTDADDFDDATFLRPMDEF